MPIIPAPEVTVTLEDRDKVTPTPVDETLSVASTSQTLFTVPPGQKLRAFSLVNRGPGGVHIRLASGAATTADTELEKKNDSWSEDDLDLPAGTYEFIGALANRPRVTGLIWTGPA